MDEAFVAERLKSLQTYLNLLLSVSIVPMTPLIVSFLNLPTAWMEFPTYLLSTSEHEKKGWLMKRGSSVGSGWSRRFISLRDRVLYYSVNDKPPFDLRGQVACMLLQLTVSNSVLTVVRSISRLPPSSREQVLAKIMHSAFSDRKGAPSFSLARIPARLSLRFGFVFVALTNLQVWAWLHVLEGKRYSPSMEDFEPLTVLGKGSFGRVLRVKKKDSGEV